MTKLSMVLHRASREDFCRVKAIRACTSQDKCVAERDRTQRGRCRARREKIIRVSSERQNQKILLVAFEHQYFCSWSLTAIVLETIDVSKALASNPSSSPAMFKDPLVFSSIMQASPSCSSTTHHRQTPSKSQSEHRRIREKERTSKKKRHSHLQGLHRCGSPSLQRRELDRRSCVTSYILLNIALCLLVCFTLLKANVEEVHDGRHESQNPFLSMFVIPRLSLRLYADVRQALLGELERVREGARKRCQFE